MPDAQARQRIIPDSNIIDQPDSAAVPPADTPHIGSLYEAFDPVKARELARRLEIHYTPKHSSWLNIAESELSVLGRQCLDRRIESMDRLASECQGWNIERNTMQKGVDWQFTTADARIKLKRLYPHVQI
jgi:hypothetical protein